MLITDSMVAGNADHRQYGGWECWPQTVWWLGMLTTDNMVAENADHRHYGG